MTHNLAQLKQNSVILSDLDGLLVNSNNFNQIFIQRTDPAWINQTIRRVVKSEVHLVKFFQVLIAFIISERHPTWANHALTWLLHLLNSTEVQRHLNSNAKLQRVCAPLLSYSNEMVGLKDVYTKAALRGVAVEQWAKSQQTPCNSRPHGRNYYDINVDLPSTGYVFIDDSDEDSGPSHHTRKRKHRQASSSSSGFGAVHAAPLTYNDDGDDDDNGTDDIDLENDDDVLGLRTLTDGDEEDDDDDDSADDSDVAVDDSDHGVFDVNETASSDETRQIDGPVDGSIFPNLSSEHTDKLDDENLFDELGSSDEDEDEEDEEDDDDEEEEDNLFMWTSQSDDASDDSADSTVEDQPPEPVSQQTNNNQPDDDNEGSGETTEPNKKNAGKKHKKSTSVSPIRKRITRSQMNRTLHEPQTSPARTATPSRQTRNRKSL